MKKIQITLLVEESKELIARGVIQHPLILKALKKNKVVIKGGTTTSRISEKLINKPLRLCGRITERGTVTSYDNSEEPNTIILEKGSYRNIDSVLFEEINKLECDDVIVTSANIVDCLGNAAIMGGSIGGGEAGKSLGAWYTEGAKILIPAGIEKLVPGNVNDILKNTGRKNKVFSYGMAVGLFPLIGEVVDEIKALEILTQVKTFPIGSGGLEKAQGSVTLEVQGNTTQIERTIKLIKNIKLETTNFSATDGSKTDCRFPNYSCKHHIGCSYKSQELQDKKIKKIGLINTDKNVKKVITEQLDSIFKNKIYIYNIDLYNEADKNLNINENSSLNDSNKTESFNSKKTIKNLIQDGIYELEDKKCDIIILSSLSEIESIKSKVLLVFPNKLINNILNSLSLSQIGICVADEKNISYINKYLVEGDVNPNVIILSPFEGKENIEIKVEKLKNSNLDLILMYDMKYTEKTKKIIEEKTEKKIILPNSLISNLINGIL